MRGDQQARKQSPCGPHHFAPSTPEVLHQTTGASGGGSFGAVTSSAKAACLETYLRHEMQLEV